MLIWCFVNKILHCHSWFSVEDTVQFNGMGSDSSIPTWQERVTAFLADSNNPLIVIVGPTASGKTAFSIAVASYISSLCPPERSRMGTERMPWFDSAHHDNFICEILNADSRQLYREMDIGTAKITKEEMQGIPHHFIDILDPNEGAAAGWYQNQAEDCIAEIKKRGNVPILVGGSMLYVSALIDGLTMAPVADDALRNRLMNEYDIDNGASLFKQLKKIDPKSAEQIHQNNKSRLVRAVEIVKLTGNSKPTSQLRSGKKDEQNLCTQFKYDTLILGLQLPRDLLHDRINKRTRQMFECGWIDEVHSLLDKGYTADDPGMKSHGYREIMNFLQNEEPETQEELIDIIAAKTRQYARRQLTWWRYDPRINWIEI